jgi:hypothetical protein
MYGNVPFCARTIIVVSNVYIYCVVYLFFLLPSNNFFESAQKKIIHESNESINRSSRQHRSVPRGVLNEAKRDAMRCKTWIFRVFVRTVGINHM